jgi:hypothetical protein
MRNENSVCNFPRIGNLIADNVVCAVVVGTEWDAPLACLRTTTVTFPYTNDLTLRKTK